MNTTTNTRGVSEAMVELAERIWMANDGSFSERMRLVLAALSATEPAAQGEAKPAAWRYKLTDGSFQYGTAGHEVRIPRPIVEATPLYTAPPAQPAEGGKGVDRA